MGLQKYMIRIRPMQNIQLGHLPTGAELGAALKAAGVAMPCAVSDLYPYGFFPKPVDLNMLLIQGQVDPLSFKRLQKAKYISQKLMNLLYTWEDGVTELCKCIADGEVLWQDTYLYYCTEKEPPELDRVNTRQKKPFVKEMNPKHSFWFFVSSQQPDGLRLSSITIGGVMCEVEQILPFRDADSDRCLLLANMRVLPGSRIGKDSKSLFRLSLHDNHFVINAGALLDPEDRINEDPQIYGAFILHY